MDPINESEYQESENCPGCGWLPEDSIIGPAGKVADGALIEEDIEMAPPDAQSTFYICYSATWYITCQNCGTKYVTDYDNY